MSLVLALAAAASAESYPAQDMIDQWRSICAGRSDAGHRRRAEAAGFAETNELPADFAAAIGRWRAGGEITVSTLRGSIGGRSVWIILRRSAGELTCDLQDLGADRDDYDTVAAALGPAVGDSVNGGRGEMSAASLRRSVIAGADDATVGYWPPPDDGVPTGLTLQAVRYR